MAGKHTGGSGTAAAPFKVKKEEPELSGVPSHLGTPGVGGMPPMPTRQEAMVAAMAHQTLLGRLGNAFWDAFSGGSSSGHSGAGAGHSHASGGQKSLDADKVKRVLEGRAVVRVVDVDEKPVKAEMKGEPIMSRVKAEPVSPRMGKAEPMATVKTEKGECVKVADMLEESMRALSLGKK